VTVGASSSVMRTTKLHEIAVDVDCRVSQESYTAAAAAATTTTTTSQTWKSIGSACHSSVADGKVVAAVTIAADAWRRWTIVGDRRRWFERHRRHASAFRRVGHKHVGTRRCGAAAHNMTSAQTMTQIEVIIILIILFEYLQLAGCRPPSRQTYMFLQQKKDTSPTRELVCVIR
jgi:hypothetical protein